MPEVLKRKSHKGRNRQNKRILGNSIELRPEIAAKREEEGHWEGDTVVGLRAGRESVVLMLIEKKTQNYLAIRIPGKNSDAVMTAMTALREEYGDRFGHIHTCQGVLYLSMIRDLYDNSIVAHKIGADQTVNLVLNTINAAMQKEGVAEELQLHSDQG